MPLMTLTLLCAALCAAVILVTIAQTRDAYPGLPDSVPIHLDAFGNVNGLGPRPMIWALPLLQIVSAGAFAFSGWSIALAHGRPLGMAAFCVCITALVWRTQLLLLEAAKAPDRRVDIAPFWWQFAFLMIAGVAMVTLLT